MNKIQIVIACFVSTLLGCKGDGFTFPLSRPTRAAVDQRLIGRWENTEKKDGGAHAFVCKPATGELSHGILIIDLETNSEETNPPYKKYLAFTTFVGDTTYINIPLPKEQYAKSWPRKIQEMTKTGWNRNVFDKYWIGKYEIEYGVLRVSELSPEKLEPILGKGEVDRLRGKKDAPEETKNSIKSSESFLAVVHDNPDVFSGHTEEFVTDYFFDEKQLRKYMIIGTICLMGMVCVIYFARKTIKSLQMFGEKVLRALETSS